MPNSCSDEMNVFAKSTSGEMLHISEVTSGLKCNCTCPGCDEPMIAYKGSALTPFGVLGIFVQKVPLSKPLIYL